MALKNRLSCTVLLTACGLATMARADWPMPGHDPARSSRSGEAFVLADTPLWHVRMNGLIPSRAHIITAAANGNVPATVYVTTAEGIYALNPDTGAQRFLYAMELPPGDAPSVVDNVIYIAGTDKTVHAVDAETGTLIWQSDSAGAPYYSNPLVVAGRVYVGNHDGFFYSFHISDGTLDWYYSVGEKISYAAAYSTYSDHPAGIVFFAAENNKAYALEADTGNPVWPPSDLPGSTYVGFWPVIAGERVIFVASTSYPTDDTYDLNGRAREEVVLDEAALQARVDGQGRLNVQHHIDWLTLYPQRRTVLVLDRNTGQQAEIAPILWWGNPGGQRYPPSIGADGTVWITSTWGQGWFCSGRYAGWQLGTNLITPKPALLSGLEAGDEPEAQAIIGGYLYFTQGGDGGDKAGVFHLTGGADSSWGIDTYHSAFGDYWGAWADRKYGNNASITDPNNRWANSIGWHGHQNPPVPLDNKVYFHRSNAVICMGQ